MKSGEDYAFQITQGGERNYSALLKAGPPVKAESASQSSQTNTATNTNTNTSTNTNTNFAQTSSSSSSSTDNTGTSATQAIGMASKPLISSSTGATPYSSPVSSTTVTNSVTVAEPFETSNVMHGKKASATASVQTGSASSLQSYSQVLMGALVLLVFLVQ